MKIKECFGLFLACATIAMAATITPKKPVLKDGCYQIGTAEELFGFAEISNQRSYDNPALVCAKLTDNIVINKNVLDEDGDLISSKAKDLVAWTHVRPSMVMSPATVRSYKFMKSTKEPAAFVSFKAAACSAV